MIRFEVLIERDDCSTKQCQNTVITIIEDAINKRFTAEENLLNFEWDKQVGAIFNIKAEDVT